MKGGGKCATNEQEAETGMGAVSERTKPDHLQRAMPEVSALMQAELPSIGDRLPAFFEKGEKTKMKLELIKASDVEIKEVEWLWYPYIPYGKVTVLQGDSGDGKSTFVLNLAAMLSRGARPCPLLRSWSAALPVDRAQRCRQPARPAQRPYRCRYPHPGWCRALSPSRRLCTAESGLW